MSTPATSPKQSLVEELRDYYEQIENIKEDALELTAPLTEDQFNWRPSPKRWSISECLVHLNLADGLDLPALAAEIERNRSANITGQGPFRYSFFSRLFIRYAEPPPKLRVPAPKAYRPPAGHQKDQVVPEFCSIHDSWLQLLVASNGLDLARIKVKIPIGFMFSLGQRFALVTAHDRRHLWQAWEVRKHAKFPV
jgi:DinB superfamily